jgi:hypothetical protein
MPDDCVISRTITHMLYNDFITSIASMLFAVKDGKLYKRRCNNGYALTEAWRRACEGAEKVKTSICAVSGKPNTHRYEVSSPS